MRQIVQPLTFNPWLGLAVKGMWTTKAVQVVIETNDIKDPEPSSEAEAA
jgi:hypothetical protein